MATYNLFLRNIEW